VNDEAKPIRVIMGIRPIGLVRNANANNQNLKYPILDARIRDTYVAHSVPQTESLYDSYIRALRWASDRINGRVCAFISNGLH